MTLTRWQFEYNGLIFGGDDTPYRIQKVTGIRGLPATEQPDVAKARMDGYYPALQLLGERQVQIAMIVAEYGETSVEDALMDFANAMSPIMLPSNINPQGQLSFDMAADSADDWSAPLWLWARPVGPPQAYDIDLAAAVGYYPITQEFMCADPIIYGTPPLSGGGQGTYPNTFAANTNCIFNNAGNYATFPIINLVGPLGSDNPIYVIFGPPDGSGDHPTLTPGTSPGLYFLPNLGGSTYPGLDTGDWLTIDCFNHTITGSVAGATDVTDFYSSLDQSVDPTIQIWPYIAPMQSFADDTGMRMQIGTSNPLATTQQSMKFFSGWYSI